jgi:hypothetical protein
VVSFTLRPLYPQGKSSWYPLDRRLGGPQSRSGRGGEEKNSQSPQGIEPPNPDRPAHSQSLYRLNYPGSLERALTHQNYVKVRVKVKVKWAQYLIKHYNMKTYGGVEV